VGGFRPRPKALIAYRVTAGIVRSVVCPVCDPVVPLVRFRRSVSDRVSRFRFVCPVSVRASVAIVAYTGRADDVAYME